MERKSKAADQPSPAPSPEVSSTKLDRVAASLTARAGSDDGDSSEAVNGDRSGNPAVTSESDPTRFDATSDAKGAASSVAAADDSATTPEVAPAGNTPPDIADASDSKHLQRQQQQHPMRSVRSGQPQTDSRAEHGPHYAQGAYPSYPYPMHAFPGPPHGQMRYAYPYAPHYPQLVEYGAPQAWSETNTIVLLKNAAPSARSAAGTHCRIIKIPIDARSDLIGFLSHKLEARVTELWYELWHELEAIKIDLTDHTGFDALCELREERGMEDQLTLHYVATSMAGVARNTSMAGVGLVARNTSMAGVARNTSITGVALDARNTSPMLTSTITVPGGHVVVRRIPANFMELMQPTSSLPFGA